MSYFRASTANNQGWRPGTVQGLGYMSSARENGPDWKTVAAHQAAASRAQQHHHRQRQRANDHRMAIVDAAARGDRTRVRTPRLSALGLNAINLSSIMVNGAQYVFHFRKTGVTLGVTDMVALASTVAADSNFLNPVAVDELPNGFQVRFVYNGQPNNVVANMGAEMQKVINDHGANGIGLLASAYFTAAEGGPALTSTPSQNVTVVAVNTNGTLQLSDGGTLDPTTGITTNADGSIRTAQTTSPGDGGGSGNFDLTSLVSGLGIGGVVALGLGLIFVMRS